VSIHVKKKNGTFEALDISKIKKQTMKSCEGLTNVSADELELDSNIQFTDGMSTEDIQKTLIDTAASKIDIDRPDWSFVAARLFMYDLYKSICALYGKDCQGNPYETISLREYIQFGVDQDRFRKELLDFDLENIQESINPENDKLFNYLGAVTLVDKYLIRARNSDYTFELPQYMLMANAMSFALVEKDKEYWAKEFYQIMSDQEFITGTPSISNGRLKDKSCFSCFVGTTPDSLDGIFDSYKEMAFISKFGGGIGWDWSRIRAGGGPIDGHKGAAGGKVPFLRIVNDIALAVDQLGVRKGAIKVYIESWDLEVLDFIDLKKQSGEIRRRAHDLFTAVSCSDLFMQRAENEEMWTLFDPYDVADLCETFGDEFESKYLAYEELANKGKIRSTKINAKDLWKKIILSYYETGSPDLFFKDHTNNGHMNKHLGIIRSGNLCSEYMAPTDEEHTAVCNLGSINLAKVNTRNDLARVVPIAVRLLDNIIDISGYPSEKAKRTQMERRSIGLGIMGEAEMIATKLIKFGSAEHESMIHEVYGALREISEITSMSLADEKGTYPMWEGSEWGKQGKKMRNAYLLCIAPTSSISILFGTTQSIEPVYKRKWFEENLSGLIPVVAPNINAENYQYYESVYDVDQMRMVELTGIRQKYIDMAISHNIFLDPKTVTGKQINDILMYSWKKGMKSTYYLRSKSYEKEEVNQDKILCEGCQ